MRRQLFQVVSHDLRIRSSTPVLPCRQDVACPSSQGMQAGWPDMLKQICDEAGLALRYGALHAAAEELGVAWWYEVADSVHELAEMAGLKPLERKRFLDQLRS